MLAILISSISSLYIFISLGILAERILKVKFQFTDRVLVGLSVTNTLVSFVSLFLPITVSVLYIFLLFCSVFLYFERENLKSLAFDWIRKSIVFIIGVDFFLKSSICLRFRTLSYSIYQMDSGIFSSSWSGQLTRKIWF
ncbi:hypothetical protein LEP1GSC132_0923 [Leptospira kirschneri str. 200803703]|nr:hypothetical protein LEP1GSC132_0923 [Leptospira kirschneri str. 200803703]